MSDLNIVYAGDRDISVWVLQYLVGQGVRPQALLVSDAEKASHAHELRALCGYLDEAAVFEGKAFRQPNSVQRLEQLQPDYMVCIHFPYIIPQDVLRIPRYGVVNLHPAYLPYNRGWHTPSWALLENTPVGATLHFMDEGVDTGDVVHQRELIPSPSDTAHSLYTKLKQLEFEVFKEAWPSLTTGDYTRLSQRADAGSIHKRKDLFVPEVQEINMDTPQLPRDLLRQLRALTTNDSAEAAYFWEDGKKYRVQVHITEE